MARNGCVGNLKAIFEIINVVSVSEGFSGVDIGSATESEASMMVNTNGNVCERDHSVQFSLSPCMTVLR